MKKVFALIGSRQKKGNTITFVKNITKQLSNEEFQVEYVFPQDYDIKPCVGCSKCFTNCKCVNKDDIELLQQKILESDILIIASPVYLHYFTGDLKLILDKLAWWAHTFRLQGKPVVVLSTCSCNAFTSVIKPLSSIISYMGGNVIATANASYFPNQINNSKWLSEVSQEIAKRISKYVNLPPQSNKDIEKLFPSSKYMVMLQSDTKSTVGVEPCEYNFWRDSGMLEYNSFEEYLQSIGR
ncbi:NADPH-dependent FMN reductase [Lachnotalea glycerini]|uniref:NADPH-dependent FMN reductase n=1 Tax=Lachnotalea glycerini TaxID=1763509 RepID=A0A318ENM4_9FIRM|nr:flavodoxin family protein [Lachnotalea glycerini]PXV91685.1 NADPH-dependent FMN reductase [Lachnotalea glycerini]